jgi:hypothetical protein
VLFTYGVNFDTGYNLPTPSEVKDGDSAHLFTVTVDPPASNDIYSVCDQAMWPSDATAKSLIAKPSNVLAIALTRSSDSAGWSMANFSLSKQPFGIEQTVWLDRYSLEKGADVLERRKMLAELESSRRELEEAKTRLSTHEVPVNAFSGAWSS